MPQKALSHLTVHDHMTLAKLSERSSSPTFGGCDQLVLALRSKIANRCGITLRRKKCTHHYGEPPPANRGCQFLAPSIFFPFHHSRTYAGQFSSFIPSASQSLRNFTASRSASLTSRKSKTMLR